MWVELESWFELGRGKFKLKLRMEVRKCKYRSGLRIRFIGGFLVRELILRRKVKIVRKGC